MSNIINIPSTTEEAVEQLGNLGRLISASKWERAAIITMLVGPPTGPGRKPLHVKVFPYTIEGLRDLGVHGLRSNATITHYRNQWCNVRPVPKPGEEVDLDGLGEWTGTNTAKRREEREAEAVAPPTPEAITKAIMSDPKAQEAAREAVGDALERDARAAIISVGGDPDNRKTVPDPVPRYKRLLDRIFADVMELGAAMGELRRNGQPHVADRVLSDLREVLANALAEVTEIPDTIEGIESHDQA